MYGQASGKIEISLDTEFLSRSRADLTKKILFYFGITTIGYKQMDKLIGNV